MVWLGKYVLVQVLIILVEISRTSANSCGSSTFELEASPHISLNLTSPSYPFNYPPSQKCHWKITAPAGHVVVLTFLDFYLGRINNFRSSGCSDWITVHLEIYDIVGHNAEGKLLGRYCSTYLPPKVFSSGTSLFLEFKSDMFTKGRGFKLEYSAAVPKPDSSICSPFNTYSQNNDIQVSASSGYIESPLYGTKYPSNMKCTWVITVPEGKIIKLTFLDFSVGQNFYICTEGRHDYVEIRDGRFEASQQIGQYCSSSKPSPIHSSGRYMWIRFKSNSDNYLDESGNTNGFRARYEDENMSIAVGEIIGIVLPIVVATIIIVVCLRRRRRRRSLPNRAQMRQPITQTTLIYNNQNPTSAPSYPTVHYSPAPQSSYPPPSSGHPSPQEGYQHPPPGSTGDAVYTPQPSAPIIIDHPSGTFLNDPPPTYSEVVPDVPPPPYPGISPNPSHISTTQHPTTS